MFRDAVPDDRSRDVEAPFVAVLSTARSPRPTEWRPARPRPLRFAVATGNGSVRKIITNYTIIFFLNYNQHFGNFKPQQFPSAV